MMVRMIMIVMIMMIKVVTPREVDQRSCIK